MDFSQQLQQELNKMTPIMKRDAQNLANANARVTLAGVRRAPIQADSQPGTGIATVVDKAMAIADIYDMQERCGFYFIILGDLAKAIRENRDTYDGEKIEFGFYKRNLVPEVKSLFATWGFQETPFGYKYFFSPPTKWDVKIPVEIHVIQKKWKFLDNPDVGFFGVDEYKLPNPFAKYWEVRGVVR